MHTRPLEPSPQPPITLNTEGAQADAVTHVTSDKMARQIEEDLYLTMPASRPAEIRSAAALVMRHIREAAGGRRARNT